MVAFSLGGAGAAAPITAAGFGVAIIPLFYSYDGWEFLSWVGGEIKEPRRNLPLALIFGILLVIVTYLLANALFLYALRPLRSLNPRSRAAAMGTLFSANVVGGCRSHRADLVWRRLRDRARGARIYYSMPRMAHSSPEWRGCIRAGTPPSESSRAVRLVCVLILSAATISCTRASSS